MKDSLNKEGDDAVEGGHEGGLHDAAPESDDNAGGGEEGKDGWVFAEA